MKFSRLLVMSTLCLSGTSVWAADLSERLAPEAPTYVSPDVTTIDRTPQSLEIGKTYVIYNPGADKFFYEGNAWGTQASVSATNALLTRFVLPAGKSLSDGLLYLRDYSEVKGKWHTAFVATDSKVVGAGLKAGVFVDNADGTAAYMSVTDAGNNNYYISVSAQNTNMAAAEGEVWGVDPDFPGIEGGETGTVINPFADINSSNTKWQFFAAGAEWNDYFTALDVFNKSEELKALINRAEAMGVDVSAAVAVYNNLDATLAELEAAMEALQKSMAGGIDSGTPDSPTDATGLLANPDFPGTANGWQGSKPGLAGNGDHGPAEVGEFYNNTFDMYQDLAGMPAGVYGLTANTAFRGSWDDFVNKTNQIAFLYAKVGDVENQSLFNNLWSTMNTTKYAGPTEFGTTASEGSVADGDATYYGPNDPSAFRLYYEQGYYQNAVFFYSDGTARVGVKKASKAKNADGAESTTDWAMFDNFKLTYYGNEAGSYQKWVEQSAPKFSEVATISPVYTEALNALVAQQNATDAATAKAAVETIMASQELENIYLNQRLWAKFEAAWGQAQSTMADPTLSSFAMELSDYIQSDADEIREGKSATNEELEAAIAEIKRLIDVTIANAKDDVQAGDEVTKSYLVNADFNAGGQGWKTGSDSRPGIAYRENIAEAYDTNFDVYQDVVNPKKGVYKLVLQGFFRMERDNTAYNMWTEKQQITDAGVYVGTELSQNKTFLKCVYDEPVYSGTELASVSGMWACDADGNYYPNDMHSAAACFEAGMYENTAFGLVANEGETMRVGVKGDVRGANWICWDNFKLYYMGNDAETISPILAETATAIDLTTVMGRDVYDQANAAVVKAMSLIGGTDGDAMFQALTELFDIRDKVTASQKLIADLKALNENELVHMFDNYVNDAALEEAQEVFNIIDGITDNASNTVKDADVPVLINRMKKAMQALQMPQGAASDDAPLNMSGAILTNSFANADGDNSNTWWEGTKGSFGNDDEQKATVMLEFYNVDFDMYQDVEGLPAGTYELSVNAFKRGKAEQDKATPTECQGAFLYATADGQKVSKNLPTIYAGSTDMDADIPNNMVTSQEFFQREGEPYRVRVIVKKGEGTLRVGITQPVHSEGDWVILDDFQLFYFGAESAKEQSGDGIDLVDANAEAQSVQFFTVDGRQASRATKGLVIVKVGDKVVKRIQK